MDMEKMLRESGLGESLKGTRGDPWVPKGSMKDMQDELTDRMDTFNKPSVFNVGDIITPKRGAGIKGRGRPFFVVEIRAMEYHNTDGGNRAYPVDIVNAILLDDDLVFFKGHSSNFEPYVIEESQATA